MCGLHRRVGIRGWRVVGWRSRIHNMGIHTSGEPAERGSTGSASVHPGCDSHRAFGVLCLQARGGRPQSRIHLLPGRPRWLSQLRTGAQRNSARRKFRGASAGVGLRCTLNYVLSHRSGPTTRTTYTNKCTHSVRGDRIGYTNCTSRTTPPLLCSQVPFNLALFGQNAADKVRHNSMFSYDHWIVGGSC